MALAAVLALPVPTAAMADEYCLGGHITCLDPSPGLQQALDAASAHPGPDTVRLGFGDFTAPSGFVYSDGGDPANGLTLAGTRYCEPHTACGQSIVTKGGAGGSVLRFVGGGEAPVKVTELDVHVPESATGVVLPPGAVATELGIVALGGGAVGVILDGGASKPATFRSGSVSALQPSGGSPSVAVHVPNGHGVVAGDGGLFGDVGVSSAGAGTVEIRDGDIHSPAPLSVSRARLAGTLLELMGAGVGVDVACPAADSPDASVYMANVALIGHGSPGTVGIRARARGGDSVACDAAAEITSSVVTGFEATLSATGEAGVGADPRAGTSSISSGYSDLYGGELVEQEPAVIDAGPAAGNLDADPRFLPPIVPRSTPVWPPFFLSELDVTPLFDSPLIDHGDPAPLEPWQAEAIPIVHGRRDIGLVEYGFHPPEVRLDPEPDALAAGMTGTFSAHAYDFDPGDPLELLLRSDDESSSARSATYVDLELRRTFESPGSYSATAVVTDPIGFTASVDASTKVAPASISRFELAPRRFRATRRGRGFAPRRPGARISYRLFGVKPVRFTVERGVLNRRGRILRWRRLRGGYTHAATLGSNTLRFRGRLNGRSLRPGRFRLIAEPEGGRPVKTRFTIEGIASRRDRPGPPTLLAERSGASS